MSNGYPYRVGIWRRALEERHELVRKLTRATPAVLGVLLLLFTIPSIGRVLSTEIELTEGGVGQIQVATDCPGLFLAAYLYPEYREGSDPPGDYEVSEVGLVELIVTGSYLDPGCGTAKLTFFHTSARVEEPPEVVATHGDVRVTEDGWIQVDFNGPSVDLPGGLPTDPTEPLSSDPRGSPPATPLSTPLPSLSTAFAAGSSAALPSDPRLPLEAAPRDDLEQTPPEASVLIKWPGLYRYSHRGHGWVNRWLDQSSAGIYFAIRWNGGLNPQTSVPMDADLTILSPYDYEVSYTRDAQLDARSQGSVSYKNFMDSEGEQGVRSLHATTRFRTSSYEPKLNYVLLAGGAAVGLGITLIVESLISALVRFERSLRKRRKRRQAQPAPPPAPPAEEGGDEAE